jgi:hypothetical protein
MSGLWRHAGTPNQAMALSARSVTHRKIRARAAFVME